MDLQQKNDFFQLILNSSQSLIDEYREDLIAILNTHNYESESDMQNAGISARRDYLDSVSNSVFAVINGASSTISQRLSLAMLCPALCGYPDIDIAYGIGAGSLYAMAYHAFTNKIAKSADCIILNHIQNEIIGKAICEAEATMAQ